MTRSTSQEGLFKVLTELILVLNQPFALKLVDESIDCFPNFSFTNHRKCLNDGVLNLSNSSLAVGQSPNISPQPIQLKATKAERGIAEDDHPLVFPFPQMSYPARQAVFPHIRAIPHGCRAKSLVVDRSNWQLAYAHRDNPGFSWKRETIAGGSNGIPLGPNVRTLLAGNIRIFAFDWLDVLTLI